MISLNLRVVTEEGSRDYEVRPKTVVEFERQFGMGVGKAFQNEQRAEHVYWIAWRAIKDSGQTVKPFDAWLDSVHDVQMLEGDDRP